MDSSRYLCEEVLVRASHVGKIFCRDFKRSLSYGISDIARELLPFLKNTTSGKDSRDLRTGEFWANYNLSFEVRRGECLGLIGHNGAGKTTLLKMLNGLITPDAGNIEMHGRVGAIIALGAGFNPILTGRENIYVNGAIMGLTKKEIDDRLEEIIDFSGIGDFIDSAVQSYSSGMTTRLGFAVATAMNPDILIIDEVLAVGDTSFRVKCYNRIQRLLPETAVIFVSHNMFDIARTCSRVLLLDHGKEYYQGNIQKGIHEYNLLNAKSTDNQNDELIIHLSEEIESASLIKIESGSGDIESWLNIQLNIGCKKEIRKLRGRVLFYEYFEDKNPVAEWDSLLRGDLYELEKGENILLIKTEKIRLRSGIYRVVVVITDFNAQGYYLMIEHGLMVNIENNILNGAPYRI